MNKRFRAWINLTAVRNMAKLGAEAMPKEAGMVRRAAARSDGATNAFYWCLRQVYYEHTSAGTHDVAAALALVAVDICRAKGPDFDLRVAELLYFVADSRHRAGEPALEVIEESMAAFERHPSKARAPHAVALGLLAEVHHAAGQREAAVDAAQQALDLEKDFGSANVPAAKLRLARVSA